MPVVNCNHPHTVACVAEMLNLIVKMLYAAILALLAQPALATTVSYPCHQGLDAPATWPEGFARTNRGLREIFDLYGYAHTFTEDLRDKAVLDIGTGGGKFVEDLRAEGVLAIGVDVYLEPAQRTCGFFVQSCAKQIPLPDESFDIIFSTFSVFFQVYGFHFQDGDLREFLNEAARLLKPGGKMYVFEADVLRLAKLLEPGARLRVLREEPPRGRWAGSPGMNLVLERL